MNGVNGTKEGILIRTIVLILVGGSIGVVTGIGIDVDKVVTDGGEALGIVILVGFVVSFLLHIVVHELGHIVCGLLSGYQFMSYRFLSFLIYKKEDKLAFSKSSVPGIAGQALMVAPDIERSERPYLLYNLGGILSNAIVAVIAMIGCVVSSNWCVITCLGTLCISGVVAAVTNGVPTTISGISDGCNIRSMLKYPVCRKAFFLQLETVRNLYLGATWDVLNEEEYRLEAEGEANKTGLVVGSRLLRINFFYTRREFARAKEYIESLPDRKKYAKMFQMEIERELLFLELITENEENRVKELYTNQMKTYLKSIKGQVAINRVQMALAYFNEKNEEEAMKYYELGLENEKHSPYAGDAKMEVGLLDYLKNRMNQEG